MGEEVTRRELLDVAVTAGLLVATTGTAGTARAAVGDAWRMHSHDAANSGAPTGSTGPATDVERRWRFAADGSVDSSPAVIDGTVYVGTGRDHLYALVERDGAGTDAGTLTGWRPLAAGVTGLFVVGSLLLVALSSVRDRLRSATSGGERDDGDRR